MIPELLDTKVPGLEEGPKEFLLGPAGVDGRQSEGLDHRRPFAASSVATLAVTITKQIVHRRAQGLTLLHRLAQRGDGLPGVRRLQQSDREAKSMRRQGRADCSHRSKTRQLRSPFK